MTSTPRTDAKAERILNELGPNNNQRFAAMCDFARELEHEQLNEEQISSIANRIADKLLFISGINKPATELVPRLRDPKNGNEVEAGGYIRSELIELITLELRRDF